jgi:hypothetical protein
MYLDILLSMDFVGSLLPHVAVASGAISRHVEIEYQQHFKANGFMI